jgi:2,4-dienoyl-CoA reductase-like NADH-dependent reductase (Old Yellow Enzyme family)
MYTAASVLQLALLSFALFLSLGAHPGTGMPSDWQLVHLGQFALRGYGYISTEASSVTENGMTFSLFCFGCFRCLLCFLSGRISPEDLGIWSDNHIPAYKRITDFVKAQGT